MKCNVCGMEIPADTRTCPVCGGEPLSTTAGTGAGAAAAEAAPISGMPEVLWEGRYSLQDMNLVWFGTILLTIGMVVFGVYFADSHWPEELKNPWIIWPAGLVIPVLLWILVFTKSLRWVVAAFWTVVFVGLAALLQFREQVLQLPALQYWSIFLAVPIVFWIWAFCVAIYRKTIVWRLTPHRLFKRHGIFVRTEDALELRVIRDMAKMQSLIERFLCGGVGRICIWSSDPSDPVLIIRGLRDYNRAFALIDEARQRIRERRALITD
ncbi:MAG: PH domain-containing protein [Thermoguttaceae bacterium]|nr:PH domain-containing protein [Thermoguttaceae bacterium]MDW8079479.1 PH domain-containing protein [Thermoguttaceae bacterium]